MNEEFKELFSNLSEKDQKEVANLIRFKNEVKYHDKQFEELLNQYIELSREHDKLQNNWNELKKMIEDSIIAINELVDNPNDEAHTIMKGTFGRVLNMMQELEGKSE